MTARKRVEVVVSFDKHPLNFFSDGEAFQPPMTVVSAKGEKQAPGDGEAVARATNSTQLYDPAATAGAATVAVLRSSGAAALDRVLAAHCQWGHLL
jgi:hypothetical protein